MNITDISFFMCDTCAFSTLSGRKEPPEKCDYYVPYENAHTGMEYSPRMLRKMNYHTHAYRMDMVSALS